MKVLYHHRTLADGAEGIHIAEMVEAFHELGHHVQMAAAVKPSAVRGQGHAGLLSRVRRALPEWLFEVAAVGYSVVDAFTFFRRLRRVRPDFVYKRHALNDFGVALASRLAGVPLVLEVNCPYASPRHREFERVHLVGVVRWTERLALRTATLVLPVSSPLRDYLLTVGADPSVTKTTPNGANAERFFPVDVAQRAHVRRHLGLEGLVIGWVGILRAWHGMDLLVEALAAVPNATLMVIGDGPERRHLEELADRRGVTARLRIVGRVPNDEMRWYLSAVDVAIASADRTGYASPMKILEYMAMGLPTIAPRIPNIEDLISHGDDGLLFEPGNAVDLAHSIQQIAADAEFGFQLGRAARKKVETERNWRAIAGSVVEYLEKSR